MADAQRPDPPDMEALANVEHESWIGWTKYSLGQIAKELKLYRGPIRSYDLSELACVRRWQRQIKTHYADLSEKEKESDRGVVRKKLPTYRPEAGYEPCAVCQRMAPLKDGECPDCRH